MYLQSAKMNIYLFSYNTQMIQEWHNKLKELNLEALLELEDYESLLKLVTQDSNAIILCDYDTVSHDLNLLLSNTSVRARFAVFEKNPMIQTGRNLLSHKVRAYGNSRMLSTHLKQLLETLENEKTWTYPELTAALAKNSRKLSTEAQALIERLNDREKETLMLVLEGYTNAAIADSLELSVRTIKAYMHAIFEKLHVNDRLSLVLLLK